MTTAHNYRNCGLPADVTSFKLAGTPAGDKLKTYVKSAEFVSDIENGVGLFVHGTGKQRLRVFTALARAFVDLKDSVYYMSVPQLVYSLERDDGVTAHSMASSLFLTGFFCPKSDNILTLHQRMLVIRHLEDRMANRTRRLYLTSPSPLVECVKWWGSDFIASLEWRMREVSVGI